MRKILAVVMILFAVASGFGIQAIKTSTLQTSKRDPYKCWIIESGVRLRPGDKFDPLGVYGPEVVKLPEGGFRMYYYGWSEGEVTRILSAYSSDGINWVKEEGVRIDVEIPTTWQVHSPTIFKLSNGTLVMCYAGGGAGIPYFGIATSIDGLKWEKVSVRSTYEQFGRYISAPSSVVRLPNGNYRLYAVEYDGSHNFIVSLISSDGFSWSLEEGVRLNFGGTYDRTRAEGAEVIPLDGAYRMYYTGGTFEYNNQDLRILTAYSNDGLNWKKDTEIIIDAPAFHPSVVQLEDGTYRMYFQRLDGIYSALSPLQFDVKVFSPWKGKTYPVYIHASDGTINSFSFNISIGQISFSIDSSKTSALWVNVPKQVLDGAFNIYVDDVPAACIFAWTNNNTSLHFTVGQGKHTIKIEGEHVSRPLLNEFPDLNGDGKVNIVDVYIIATKFGKELQDP
jgi:predicted GH43/DUF377 family glycosyl hydrolase